MSEQTDEQIKASEKAREPFPDECIQRKDVGWGSIRFIGAAFIRERLVETDPGYWWEPVSRLPDGRPLFDFELSEVPLGDDQSLLPVGLWIRLHWNGTVTEGYGAADPNEERAKAYDKKNNKQRPVNIGDIKKGIVSDAIKICAMQRGIGLDMWKPDEHKDNGNAAKPPGGASSAKSQAAPSLPSSVICDRCEYVWEETTVLYRMAARETRGPVTKGDTIYKCTECNQFSRVVEPKPVAVEQSENPADDLPF